MNRYICHTVSGDRLVIKANNIGTVYVTWRAIAAKALNLPPNVNPPDDLASVTLVPEEPSVESE